MKTANLTIAAGLAATLQGVRERFNLNRQSYRSLGLLTQEVEEDFSRQDAEMDVLTEIIRSLRSECVTRDDLIRFCETMDRINASGLLRAMPRPAALN